MFNIINIIVSHAICICNRKLTYDDDVTPYIHVFINHVGHFLRKYGSLGPFEMEAVEQLNYVNKLVFFRASNHGKRNSPYTITEQVSLGCHSSSQYLRFSLLALTIT